MDGIDNTDSNALLCITNNRQCCNNNNNNNGNWYSPSSEPLHYGGYTVSRGPGVIRLKKINETPQTGVFHCEISAHDHGHTLNFYIGLYHSNNHGNKKLNCSISS